MPAYKSVSEGDRRGLILECSCGLNQHQIDFLYWADDKHPELYISPLLCRLPFWRRLWLGIKYILGYRSRYGLYAELVLFKKDVQALQDFLDAFLSIK